jgi:hypothetical protein
MVALTDSVDVAAQPDAAYGEAAVAFALRNLGLLQERQCAAARPDEHELCRKCLDSAVIGVLDRDTPASIVPPVKADDLAVVVDVEARLRRKVVG